MAGFKVDTEATKEYITRLKALKENNTVTAKKPDAGDSCGEVFNVLTQLDEAMEQIRRALDTLLDKTIGFLEIADETFDTADSQAAAGIEAVSETGGRG